MDNTTNPPPHLRYHRQLPEPLELESYVVAVSAEHGHAGVCSRRGKRQLSIGSKRWCYLLVDSKEVSASNGLCTYDVSEAALLPGRVPGCSSAVLDVDVAISSDMMTSPHEVHKTLIQPWQSVGAKAVTTLAAKLMLALLPPQTTFFKMQVRDDKLGDEIPSEISSELDLSFSKLERMIMDYINASSDRVMIHQAMKHLIVGGNALLYMGKDGIKHYPLNRYVVERDGNGNVLQIITKEMVSKHLINHSRAYVLMLLVMMVYKDGKMKMTLRYSLASAMRRVQWRWHQEAWGKMIPGSNGSAPKKASPWLVLRFNTVDGEDYGRGRVEEFIGDLTCTGSLSQALDRRQLCCC